MSEPQTAKRHVPRNGPLGVLIALAGICLVGCGGGSSPAPGGTAEAPAKSKPTTSASATGSAETEPTSENVRTDSAGRKWIGDIPYDVFFDDPLAIAANSTVVGGAPAPTGAGGMSGTPTPSSEPPATSAPASSAAGGATDWKSLISVEQINDETKRIRNHLTASLQSVGTYNGNYKDLQVDGAVVAAIAGIVAQHADSPSWKSNARFLREYGSKLRESSQALGRDGFEGSQTAAEGIQAVLNGNLPADAGDPPADKPFGESASRAGVMRRIEKASEWMRANINSEAVFEKETEQIRQESAILSALAKVIADKSYDSADEEDYAGWAKDLLDGARETLTAADEKAYPKFQDGINKITKACATCHASYGNG